MSDEMSDEKKYAKHLVKFGKMSHKLRNDEDRVIHTGKVKITVTLDDEDAHSFWTYNREHKDLTGTILVGPDDPQQTSCLLYTSPSPRDRTRSRMPSSA